MKCPICKTSIRESDFECASCGELLTSWHSITRPAYHIRQRGLVQASQRDYVGACVSFLEASLANPLDTASLVDAAKALVYLGRVDDALRLLDIAQNRSPDSGAADVAEAVHALLQEAQRRERDGDPQAQPDGEGVPQEPKAAAAAASSEPKTRTKQTRKVPKETARPMLALPLMKRFGPWWSRLIARERADGVWATVVELERTWKGDWGLLKSWLEAAVQASNHDPLFHYMMGLQWWQRGDEEAAKESFQHCLSHESPVLNAGAYHLCLALDDLGRAQQVRRELFEAYGYTVTEMQQMIEALQARLEDWNAPVWQQNLKQLRHTDMR